MKKILFTFLCLMAVASVHAEDRTRLTVNAGFLFPSTLNASVGYEHHLWDGHYAEIFGEIGNHWGTGDEKFWNQYYWDGGILFKYRAKQFKNGNLYLRIGPHVGAVQTKVFVGFDAGIEYNYVFPNSWVFSVIWKDDFNFIHGDHFRNGLLVGVKIPF